VNINNNPKYVLRRSILAALVLAAVSVPFVHKDAPKYEEPKTNVAIETVSNTDVKETTNITLSRGGSGLEQAINKDILLDLSAKPYRVQLHNRGRIVSFKFENIGGCDFEIKQPEFLIDFDYD
jgi:hypothetical protein